uniref:ANK_REP_REGION domain-containing protein n=1 Tax=Steinernema glaseri TaxID=37863 RepID=A0A1I7YI30_9BILA
MEHNDLMAEMHIIEQMKPHERISLAKDRRRTQLRLNDERERSLGPPPPRRPRLTFSAEVALLDATGRGDIAEVERLLAEGANPNSHNEDGLTPLHQCAIDNNESILKLLLRCGADVNAQDTEQWTPLHAAACCAHIEIVRILIAHGANLLAVNADGNMPYDICDEERTLDVIESEMSNRGITQEYIDQMRGAPEKKMLDDMKALHQSGQPLDVRMSDGSTYLHVAAANGYYDVAAFLLRCGVPPSVRDNDLWMPIHAAACWPQPDLIELLCEYGGDVNATTNANETPMQLCEDETTRQVISTMEQKEKRRRTCVRDSRRQSKKRKKFESPQQPTANQDNPFSARGAIRRLSLRDKSGLSLARIEAQQEHGDLMRSWSKEDVSSTKDEVSPFQGGIGPSHSDSMISASSIGRKESSPNKRLMHRSSHQQKPKQSNEWLQKLETENGSVDYDDDDDAFTGGITRGTRARSSTKKKKNKQAGVANRDLNEQNGGGDANGATRRANRGSDPLPASRRNEKSTCCACTIS